MKRLLRLYSLFIRNSMARELEFRANFWAKVGQQVVWIGFFLTIVNIVYGKTDSVAGFSQFETYVVLGTGFFLAAIVGGLFGLNLQELPSQVRLGTLDYVLIKPVNSQFWLSARKLSFDSLGSAVFAIGLVIYALVRMGETPSLFGWTLYLTLCFCGVVIFYSLQFCLMATAIWFIRVDNLWVLGETLMNLARWPISIFDSKMRFLLVYVLPMAYMASIPGEALIRPETFHLPYLWLGMAWAVGLFFFSAFFWRFALRFYSSASS